jgi:hypothetical protein
MMSQEDHMNLFRRSPEEPEPAGDGTTEHFFTIEISEGRIADQQGHAILDSDWNEQSTLAEMDEGSAQLAQPEALPEEGLEDAADDLMDLC